MGRLGSGTLTDMIRVPQMARPSQVISDTHPLDGKDEWECYDQHISERNKLIEAKRNAEDNFVKTVIQLSSAIALLVPSFLISQSDTGSRPTTLLTSGLG